MDIAHLEALESPSGSLVSLYLNSEDGPSSTILAELDKKLRAIGENAPRATAMSVRTDIDRIGSLSARFDTEHRPAWAVFASDADDVFEVMALPSGVATSVSVARLPYLRPLRALPAPVSILVALVQRPRVEIHRHTGSLEALGVFEIEPGKDNYGGFRGYEEARVRSKAGEETKAIWREAGGRALAAHQAHPFGGLLLAGHRYDLDAFAEQLHTYLKALPAECVSVDPHTVTPSELAELASDAAAGIRLRRHEEAIREVLDGAYEGVPIAKGASAVLRAANVGAVERLVLCGPFAKPGVRCPGCGWLARTGERCPTCDTGFEEVHDVLGAAWERVIGHGGRADQVTVASALDADGVAAVLRFVVD